LSFRQAGEVGSFTKATLSALFVSTPLVPRRATPITRGSIETALTKICGRHFSL
jgi:hypothetical protein